MSKILLLFETFSGGGDKWMNLENVSQYEFLAKHPVLLNKILNEKDKKILSLQNSEMFSIEAMFHNRAELFDYDKIKALLKAMIAFGYIEPRIEKFQSQFAITELGLEASRRLQETYFERLRKIYNEMKPLLRLQNTKIVFLIEAHLSNGIKN
jgi:predicted transcriptional regulator